MAWNQLQSSTGCRFILRRPSSRTRVSNGVKTGAGFGPMYAQTTPR